MLKSSKTINYKNIKFVSDLKNARPPGKLALLFKKV